ncbi:MAG: S1 RNA-binding domain-containing protein [Kribbellaceae bacterium]|nr:S1 RNA-binding domain-containing protein [Kribbellaceae bacterium]
MVKSLTNSGVIVDIDGEIEGYIPTAELSWASRIRHPDQAVAVGDSVRGVLVEIPEPPTRPKLSVKALTPDPFEDFKRRHRPGTRVTGVIDGRIRSTVFVDLGDHTDGAIHISELDHIRLDTAEDFSELGATIEVEVIGFDEGARRVKLSRKRTLPHPYDIYKRQYRIGEEADFTVTRVSKTHVNVHHASGARAVLHVSQLEHGRVADASEKFRPGDSIRARILTFDDDRRQIELSIKALLPEPYPAFKSTTPIGSSVLVEVTGFNDSFAYVKVTGGVEGSIHVAQISATRIGKPSDVLHQGQQVTAVIVGFDDNRKKVQLSLRQLSTPSAYSAPASTPRIRSVVVEANTVAEAVAKACQQLNVSASAVTQEVLDPGQPKRLFRAGRAARVRVTTT